MPILQKTMDYLLNLLDEAYDDRFLGLYNFLWDRMRAIRMDLRMQHIFNLEAISMLEQMVFFSSLTAFLGGKMYLRNLLFFYLETHVLMAVGHSVGPLISLEDWYFKLHKGVCYRHTREIGI